MLIRFILLFFVFAAVLLLNLCSGEVQLSVQEVWLALSQWWQSTVQHVSIPEASASYQILVDIRLPRALSAALVGAALGTSGYLLQSLSGNGLADPYLTGVSSGAGLAVAFSVMAGVDFGLIPLISLGGGIAASVVVMLLAKSNEGISVSRLLLAGVAISAFCSAVITLIICSGNGNIKSQGIYYWLAGTVSGRTWSELGACAAYVAVGATVALLMSKPLRVLSLGESTAASLGLSVGKAQGGILLAAILLCSAAVSLSGIVGFAGLVAPYFARKFFQRDERELICASALFGSLLVMLSDLAARTIAPGQEPPLGTLLCLVGGPFFLYLLLKREDGVYKL